MQFPDSVDSIVRHLENTQWWPPTIMRRHQLNTLAPLIAHAYASVPWYRQRLDALQFEPGGTSLEGWWHKVPLLTRRDIQAAGADLHSTDLPPSHGRVQMRVTSGSTGMPVAVQATELTHRFWIANTLREYQWQGSNLNEKLAVIRYQPGHDAAPPTGARLDTWSNATAHRIRTGPCVVMSIKSTTDEQVAWLRREQPAYLQTYPSIAYELTQHCLGRGIELPHLRHVYTFGEVVDSQLREACRHAWNAEVLDSYSTEEVGHVAIQCSDGGSYHIQAEHLLVEVLDDCGEPCSAGQVGRIVITDMYNYAMPLLRYEIGDYVEVGPPCACGRQLPTLRKILGRQRNLFVLPNGEKRWPSLDGRLAMTIGAKLPVRQFQAIQHSPTEIEARLVVERPLTSTEQDAIRAMIVEGIGSNFTLRFTYVDQIPRGPTGKFEDFLCEIDATD